jgi:hypothetical protein
MSLASCLPYLETGLEWELEFTALDDDVGEVQQMDLEWVQHALPGHNDLLGLFLHRQGPNQGGHFFCCLPLGKLQKTKQYGIFTEE